MSWTNGCTESSACKYKNTQEVREVLEEMGFIVYTEEEEDSKLYFYGDSETFFDEGTEVVLSLKPTEIDGVEKNLVGIISDYSCNPVDLETLEEDYDLKEGEYVVTPIIEYLQDQLVEEKDNILVITCVGFEERCGGASSPFGDITVISKFKVEFRNLKAEENKLIEEFNEQYK